MDFSLDKKHEMARTLFREFAENEVKPLAQEVDETEKFPRGTVEKMQKIGFMGIPIPKEYGYLHLALSVQTHLTSRLLQVEQDISVSAPLYHKS